MEDRTGDEYLCEYVSLMYTCKGLKPKDRKNCKGYQVHSYKVDCRFMFTFHDGEYHCWNPDAHGGDK